LYWRCWNNEFYYQKLKTVNAV
jgi:hypothetical protein